MTPISMQYMFEAQGGQPKKTTVFATELFGGSVGDALDIGCGVGTDTRYLAERGWQVHALDKDLKAYEFMRLRKVDLGRVVFINANFEDMTFENYLLVNASYSLPFCTPRLFDAMMQRIKNAVLPGGRFAGHFFGPEDDWSSRTDMTFLTKEQVLNLFQGFKIEYFEETIADNTKKWHVHHIVALKSR